MCNMIIYLFDMTTLQLTHLNTPSAKSSYDISKSFAPLCHYYCTLYFIIPMLCITEFSLMLLHSACMQTIVMTLLPIHCHLSICCICFHLSSVPSSFRFFKVWTKLQHSMIHHVQSGLLDLIEPMIVLVIIINIFQK